MAKQRLSRLSFNVSFTHQFHNMLRHFVFCIISIALHLQCGAQEVISKSSHKNTLVVRLTCNDTLQMSNVQGILFQPGDYYNPGPIGEWSEFSGDSLTLPLDMIEEMSIIKGQEVIKSQFTLGEDIGVLGENSQKWFIDSIFPKYGFHADTKEERFSTARDYYEDRNPVHMVFMDDPDETNGLKSWGLYQGYNPECAWGALSYGDSACYDTTKKYYYLWYKYLDMGNDIAHTQYDFFANIAVEQAKQHGVEISPSDSPIWMASKADVEYLLKNCGRDIMWDENIEENYHTKCADIRRRNYHTFIRLYNPNDACFYIASYELPNGRADDESIGFCINWDTECDTKSRIRTVSRSTLRQCPTEHFWSDSGVQQQRPARYACLWTSTLAPEGDDNTKAWALQITPDGCCLIKMDRATRLPALMVGRPIDPNVISTRKNINLKY